MLKTVMVCVVAAGVIFATPNVISAKTRADAMRPVVSVLGTRAHGAVSVRAPQPLPDLSPVQPSQVIHRGTDLPTPDSFAIGGNARSRSGTGEFYIYNYSTNQWVYLGDWSPSGWKYDTWPRAWDPDYLQQIGDTFYAGMLYSCDGTSDDTFVIEHAEWGYHDGSGWHSMTQRAGSSGTAGGNYRYQGDTMWIWGTWGGSHPSQLIFFDKVYAGTPFVPPPTPSGPPDSGVVQTLHPTLSCLNVDPHDEYGWELYEGSTQIEIAYSQDSFHTVTTTLQSGHTYNWHADIKVGGVWSLFFSPSWTFTVDTSTTCIAEEELRPAGSALAARTLLSVTPNPIRGRTVIGYTLPEECPVSVTMLDASGRGVRVLQRGNMAPGCHAVLWNRHDDMGRLVPAGIYFCRLQADESSVTAKVVVTE